MPNINKFFQGLVLSVVAMVAGLAAPSAMALIAPTVQITNKVTSAAAV